MRKNKEKFLKSEILHSEGKKTSLDCSNIVCSKQIVDVLPMENK